MHPDEGAPRARARAQDRAGVERLGAHDRPGRDRPRHGPGPRTEGQDREGAHRRDRAPVQEEQDRLDQGQRPAGRQGEGRRHRRRQAVARRPERDRRRDGIAAEERARHRDRSEAHHHQRRSHRVEGHPEVDRDSRQRRRGRGVRVHLPAFRQRGHDRRAAAAAGADRGRSGVRRAREIVQASGHQGPHGHQGRRREGGRRFGRRSRRSCRTAARRR